MVKYPILRLPLTEDGYHGFLIITEYLTKYPWAVPIKSKTAVEIAKHVFHYISIFGLPKEMFSDESNEFINNFLQTINELFGINHPVTSPYKLNTNGLTERYIIQL